MLANACEHANASDALALLSRIPESVNPALDLGIARLIAGCLDPDPAQRFPAIGALDDALAELGKGPPIQPAPFGCMPLECGDVASHARELAERLGDMLCAALPPAAPVRGAHGPAARRRRFSSRMPRWLGVRGRSARRARRWRRVASVSCCSIRWGWIISPRSSAACMAGRSPSRLTRRDLSDRCRERA